MASPEAKPKLLTFSVKFNSLQGVFEFPGSIKVDQALHKIAERFKEPEDALSVLHRGIAVPGDAPLEVALGAASAVTVIHVVRKSPDHKGPTTAQLLLLQNNKVSDDLHAFCSVCKSRVVARPVFICKKCSGKKGHFTRHTSEEVNFHGEVSPDHLLGSCTCSAGGETPGEGKGEKPTVLFECIACDERPVAFLKSVRDNIHKVPCMKCTAVQDIVMVLPCDRMHCLCLDCFSNYSNLQLQLSNFQNFPELGHSVICPGPDESCKLGPIRDPHHFKLVDNTGKFYKKFQEDAIQHYTATGDNVLCACKTEIAGLDTKEVKEESEEDVMVAGVRWYHKLFRITPAPPPKPPPICKRKATCPTCHLSHCLECKQVWHEGKCITVDTTEGNSVAESYPINPPDAEKACWPQAQQ